MKHPKLSNKSNLFYFVEAGIGNQKVFRSNETEIQKLEEIQTLQNTYFSNGVRDFIVIDLNFDGLEDVFFLVNPGETLNQRVWLNKGDNTFVNPQWDIDVTLKDHFIPIILNKSKGRVKFLYFNIGSAPSSRIIEIYTKTKQ